jgi:hypothetical protein
VADTDVSPEANIVRDELRNAVRNVEVAVDKLVGAMGDAEGYLRGKRRRPNVQGIAAPPTEFQVRE